MVLYFCISLMIDTYNIYCVIIYFDYITLKIQLIIDNIERNKFYDLFNDIQK